MKKPRVSLNFCDLHIGGRSFFTDLLSPHFDIIWDEPAEFIIYGHIGHTHRLQNGVKIFWTNELYGPNWKECDYAILPRLVDDPRAYYLPIYAFDQMIEPMIRKSMPEPALIRGSKPHFCAMLCAYVDRSTAKRAEFFTILNRRKKVDSGGPALNNTGFRIPKEGGGLGRYQHKINWLKNYRFNIAFENRLCLGWTTEKLVDPLHVQTIPIHWGDPQAKDFFNPDSFISAHDFKNLEDLADYVMHVESTPTLYNRYLQAAPFPRNQPTPVYDLNRLVDFFGSIFSRQIRPITQRRWFFPITKWRLAKRNKLPGQ